MKNVSYGLIDFQELELDQRHGNIGIKVSMEEVDVSPSRESVIYSQKTMEAVTSKYNRIAETVTKTINESITTDDYIGWIVNCSNILYNNSYQNEDKVLNRLANLIDKFQLKLNFTTPDNKKIAFDSNIKPLLGKYLVAESVRSERSYRTDKVSVKRDRLEISTGMSAPLYLHFDSAKPRVTSYLANIKHPNGFVIIKPNFPFDELDELANLYIHNQIEFNELLNEGMLLIDKKAMEAGKKALSDLNTITSGESDKILEVMPFFRESLEKLKLIKESKKWAYYDESIVPVDFKEDLTPEAVDKLVEKEAKADYREMVKARKASGKFIVTTPAYRPGNKTVFEKREVNTNNLTGKVIYGLDEDKADLILLAQTLKSLRHHYEDVYMYDNDYKVVKVSKANEDYVTDKTHVKDFLLQVENGVLKSEDMFKELYTCNYVVKHLQEAEYLKNFKTFEPDLVKDFVKLKQKTDKSNYNIDKLINGDKLNRAVALQVKQYTDKMDDQQFFIELKAILGEDLADQIKSIDLIDTSYIDMVNRVNEFTRVFGAFFNTIWKFTQSNTRISAELEEDIKIIIRAKRDQLEYDYPNLNY